MEAATTPLFFVFVSFLSLSCLGPAKREEAGPLVRMVAL